jgi:Protease inhibitor Inh
MLRGAPLAVLVLIASAAPLPAQAPAPTAPAPTVAPPPAAPRILAGTWEFSNADREKVCTVTFRADAGKGHNKVEFDPGCAARFPFIKDVARWSYAENDFLRLLDAKGESVLEFSEVEGGIFEAPRPGEGILFIQSAASLGPAPRTAVQMAGEWTIVRRAGKPICTLTLSDTAAGDEFVVRVQPRCDAFVTRFAPVTWQMDRGELVLKSAGGQSWRFEEGDDSKWHRLPATVDPVLIVRK